MEQKSDQFELIARYLLGELAEHEQQNLEKHYLADEALFADLLRVENELISSYLQNLLSPNQREQFEQHFLRSAERRTRVAAARQKSKLDEANSTVQGQTQSLFRRWWQRWRARLKFRR